MKVIKVSEVAKEPSKSPSFTGPVTFQSIIAGGMSGDFIINQANFSKGARNKFHTHTSDQTLIVTSGKGICATEKEEITVFPGDVIFFPAGEKHWHGAAKDSAFSHIYVTATDSKTTLVEQ